MNEFQESDLNKTLFLKSDKKVKKHKCHYCEKEYYVFPGTTASCPIHISDGYEHTTKDPFSYNNFTQEEIDRTISYMTKYIGTVYHPKFLKPHMDIIILDILTIEHVLFITMPNCQLHVAPISFLWELDNEGPRIPGKIYSSDE